MAVIKWAKALHRRLVKSTEVLQPKAPVAPSSSLQALTVAALALPGLMLPAVASAEDDEVSFQYSHYQEGKRKLIDVKQNQAPIEVESLLGKARVSLSDRIKFAFNYVQDTWSGATPYTTSPLAANGNRPIISRQRGKTVVSGASPITDTTLYLTKKFVPIYYDASGKRRANTFQPVHVLATASPETRRQGDFSLAYEWDEAAVNVGGGVSVEPDYESRFGNVGGRLDFNQKLTSLNFGLSYTDSDTAAIMDHDAFPYVISTAFDQQISKQGLLDVLHGNRKDWGVNLGLTQVLGKSTLMSGTVGYLRSSGYLENPYKAVTFVFADPDSLGSDPSHPQSLIGQVKTFLEQRPDQRNQFTAGSHFVQHWDFADAALHLDYKFFHDDWGIDAHTFEADWVQSLGKSWTITPRVRYYSQTAADFYTPYVFTKQAFAKTEVIVDPDTGQITTKTTNYDPKKLPQQYSSDQRLSGYGALSGGVVISKKLSKAVSVEAGFEYYTHAGSLKLGGVGEGSYSDFNYYQANASLNVNLSALNWPGNSGGGSGGGAHAGHHEPHHGHVLPAGVMFGHMLPEAGQFMVGYRFMHGEQGGPMLHGTETANDWQIRRKGCTEGFKHLCRVAPIYMDMDMHMLDLMYAPTDWLNFMLMPQFMEMKMNMRALNGVTPDLTQDHLHGGHQTGGVGDTGMYAMVKLFDQGLHHLHATVGVTAPTGDVGIRLRRMHQRDEGYLHYGMQLGSGTWDFKPSLTYTGQHDDWSWGAQFTATHRLEQHNDSGYALGDMFQGSIWGGYQVTNWLAGTVRGIYTEEFQIDGQFKPVPGYIGNRLVNNVNPGSKSNYSVGPYDYGSSYGGRYWDLGMGVNFTVPSGDLKGNKLGVEWVQPLQDDVNGYQLERQGILTATWSVMF